LAAAVAGLGVDIHRQDRAGHRLLVDRYDPTPYVVSNQRARRHVDVIDQDGTGMS